MAELGHLSKARHVVVGVAILGTTALAAFGVIGDGNPGERFDTFQSIVEPAEDPDALRITETFDQDFGDNTTPRAGAGDPERLRRADRRGRLVA